MSVPLHLNPALSIDALPIPFLVVFPTVTVSARPAFNRLIVPPWFVIGGFGLPSHRLGRRSTQSLP